MTCARPSDAAPAAGSSLTPKAATNTTARPETQGVRSPPSDAHASHRNPAAHEARATGYACDIDLTKVIPTFFVIDPFGSTCPATLRRSPSGRSRARRWASFVGPLRAE